MKNSRGRIIAQLDLNSPLPIADLVPLINQRINPPTPVTEADIYIRAMFILSDQTNAYGGRFPSDEHPRLADLLVDSPVLVGHRRDLLPIGRTFHALCVTQDGRNWVKSYFYWLKSAEGAETLRDNIDAGIYKECSIGFVYGLPECSICGKDIRVCPHEPMQSYAVNGEPTDCHFNYRQIDRVLETSLVYRGAIPDTSITRDLAITKASGADEPLRIDSLDDLPPATRYLITPRYEGIDIRLKNLPHGFVAARLTGEEIPLPLDNLTDLELGSRDRLARLVGYRGRERSTSAQLERYLSGAHAAVNRATLFLYPLSEQETGLLLKPIESLDCRFIRSRFVTRPQIQQAVDDLATREGVEIHLIDQTQSNGRFLYQPREHNAQQIPILRLARMSHSDDWLLDINTDQPRQFIIRQFDIARFRHSARFVADQILPPMRIPVDPKMQLSWRSAKLTQRDNALSLEVGERQGGVLRIQPIRIEGKPRYLFYRADRPVSRSKENL